MCGEPDTVSAPVATLAVKPPSACSAAAWLTPLTTMVTLPDGTTVPAVSRPVSTVGVAPSTMDGDVSSVKTGAAGATVIVTVPVAVVKFAASAGVKRTESGELPIGNTVPAAGVYAKVPAVFALALSWVAPSGRPTTMGAGVAHVTTGVAFCTWMVTDAEAPV